MNRRHFLRAILATACAPAIVRASSLMPVREPYTYNLFSGFGLATAKADGGTIPFDHFAVDDWEKWQYENIAKNRAMMLMLAMRETKERVAFNILATVEIWEPRVSYVRDKETILLPPGQQQEWDRLEVLVDREPLV